MNNRLLPLRYLCLSVAIAACREMTPPNDAPSGNDATADRPSTPTDTGIEEDGSVQPTDAGMDGGAASVTLRQLQDITDPMHPMRNARVNLSQPDLVALTPRLVIGSATGSDCRFAVWVGTPNGGDFGGIQVQEVVPRGAASNCFDAMLVRKIPMDIAVGTRITSVTNANYGEFCAGPTGSNPAMCRNFEQSQLFLGAATAAINTMGMGTAPTPLDVPVSAIGQDSMGALGMRTLALEGTLVRVRNANVRTTTTTNDGGTSFTTVALIDPMDANRSIEVQISNFPRTSCARSHFMSRNGMPVPSVTGILVPDFGVWKIRLRDERDIEGIDCSTDGGAAMDASRD